MPLDCHFLRDGLLVNHRNNKVNYVCLEYSRLFSLNNCTLLLFSLYVPANWAWKWLYYPLLSNSWNIWPYKFSNDNFGVMRFWLMWLEISVWNTGNEINSHWWICSRPSREINKSKAITSMTNLLQWQQQKRLQKARIKMKRWMKKLCWRIYSLPTLTHKGYDV